MVFEIGAEEMPPAEAQAARDQLTRLMVDALAGTRLPHGALTVGATPRRLVAIVEQVAGRESDHTRLVRGPKVSAAFGPGGAPTPAASGFARAHGVAVGDLERADVNGVEHLVVRRHEPGRPVLEALSPALAEVVTGLRAAKNMRWRDPGLAFTRPIRWLLALWGDDVVPVQASTLTAGRTTWVLRTATEPVITVGVAEEHLDHLHAAGILLDPAERRDRIVAAATELAATVGGGIDTGGESALIDQIGCRARGVGRGPVPDRVPGWRTGVVGPLHQATTLLVAVPGVAVRVPGSIPQRTSRGFSAARPLRRSRFPLGARS